MTNVDQRGFDNQRAWLTAAEACALPRREAADALRLRQPRSSAAHARAGRRPLRARRRGAAARAPRRPRRPRRRRRRRAALGRAGAGVGDHRHRPRRTALPRAARRRARRPTACPSRRSPSCCGRTRPSGIVAVAVAVASRRPVAPRGRRRCRCRWRKLRALVPADPTPFSTLQLAVAALRARDPSPWPAAPRRRARPRARAHPHARRHPRARPRSRARRRRLGRALDRRRRRRRARRPRRHDAATVAAVDAALVLCADHELNVSSFTARIAASAGADLYACVAAALATMSGPRHGGECDRFEALVAEAGEPAPRARRRRRAHAPRRAARRLRPRLYPAGDPRAAHLLEVARRLVRARPGGRTRPPCAPSTPSSTPSPPSVARSRRSTPAWSRSPPPRRCPLGAAGTLFALGRTAGWIAHALEQRTEPSLLRPRARYVGR